MPEDWDWVLEDPYILDIVALFLEGYERGMTQHRRIAESLEHDQTRRALKAGNPAMSKFYEGKTKEQIEAEIPLRATAIGVAFALRRGLQS